MRKLSRSLIAAAVAATPALGVVGTTSPADASGSVPTVTVTMGKSIALSTGTRLHAGRVLFKVVSPTGDHALQILKLVKPGYTPKQAIPDVNAAFNGNVAAVRRIDANIRWLGGTDAPAGHPGKFAETLYAGKYYFTDQNSNAFSVVTVYGTPPVRGWITNSSTIRAYDHGFKTAATMPRSGWTLFRDIAEEPHFISMQQVKSNTTAAMVRAALASNSQSQPSWILPAAANSGTISPDTQILWHYNLPAGKYLLACWWPDDQTGMPHAMMGMWKLVTLK